MEKMLLQTSSLLRSISAILVLCFLFSTSGCAPKKKVTGKYKRGTYRPYTVAGKTYYPLPTAYGYEEVGYASWYGPNFHGRRTASGEIYNMYAMTAAHKILPMNTYVRVENLSNHKVVIVRINDRGPFVKNRIIDLSYAAAKKLGIIGPGVAKVKLIALGEIKKIKRNKTIVFKSTPDFFHEDFYVQVAAFMDAQNAYKLKDKLEKEFNGVNIHKATINGLTFFKVQVDAPNDYHKAKYFEAMLENRGFLDAFLVAK